MSRASHGCVAVRARCRYTIPLPDGRTLELGERTLVMGVLNVTPDSFADGGRFPDAGAAVQAGLAMAADGADLIDVGGESTRPGALPVPVGEEVARVRPVVEGLVRQCPVPVSIDTTKAAVARAALDAGAVIVNDVSGLGYDAGLPAVVCERRAALVLTHMRGRPREMYAQADYRSVVEEVAAELAERLRLASEAGLDERAIILDPGIGFAKQAEQSLALLAGLGSSPFRALDRPWLVGPSRKSFLTAVLGELAPAERDWGTAAAVTVAVLAGAHVVRVHRVRELVQVVRVADALRAHAVRQAD